MGTMAKEPWVQCRNGERITDIARKWQIPRTPLNIYFIINQIKLNKMNESRPMSINERLASDEPVTENTPLPGSTEPEKADRLLESHSVTFNFFCSGCTISVGCKTFAFSSNEEAVRAFKDYVLDPKKAYETWRK